MRRYGGTIITMSMIVPSSPHAPVSPRTKLIPAVIRITLAGALVALSANGFAALALGPSATARKWCEKQTLHYLQKRGYQPYNWSATTYIEGDDYVTKGIWRIDVDDLKVECVTPKKGRKSSGRYKILGIEVVK